MTHFVSERTYQALSVGGIWWPALTIDALKACQKKSLSRLSACSTATSAFDFLRRGQRECRVACEGGVATTDGAAKKLGQH